MVFKYNLVRVWINVGVFGLGGICSFIVFNELLGGYMLWGVILFGCCWDMYERRWGIWVGKLWLFEFFDCVIFYEVERSEYENMVVLFEVGLFEIKIELGFFDVVVYERLVVDILDEVCVLWLW